VESAPTADDKLCGRNKVFPVHPVSVRRKGLCDEFVHEEVRSLELDVGCHAKPWSVRRIDEIYSCRCTRPLSRSRRAYITT
jgi:hypothetical protein